MDFIQSEKVIYTVTDNGLLVILFLNPLNSLLLLVFRLKNENTLLDQRPKPHHSNFWESMDFSKICVFWMDFKLTESTEICSFQSQKPQILPKAMDFAKSCGFYPNLWILANICRFWWILT